MTSFGSRLFKERLLNPILQIDKLNQMYDEVEVYQEDNLYNKIHHQLSSVIDL